MIEILPETTKNPITLIGKRAGICWGSDVSDDRKNYKRGLDCITSQHGRTLEFPNVEMVISGYSARVIREWYTHIGCLPTRLQESTRYIDYGYFDYVTPESVMKDPMAKDIYDACMSHIQSSVMLLEKQYGIPREDTALLLPFGMETTIVDKRNLRNLIDMSHQRMCLRAYLEYRKLFADISSELKAYSEEWKWIVNYLFMPKCEFLGYCPEKNGCGGYKKKEG